VYSSHKFTNRVLRAAGKPRFDSRQEHIFFFVTTPSLEAVFVDVNRTGREALHSFSSSFQNKMCSYIFASPEFSNLKYLRTNDK
jgi:hypothetical protein